jgi:hypothetical protein
MRVLKILALAAMLFVGIGCGETQSEHNQGVRVGRETGRNWRREKGNFGAGTAGVGLSMFPDRYKVEGKSAEWSKVLPRRDHGRVNGG